jgi:hypothetical protein
MIISYSPELGSLNISQTKIKMNTLAFILCGNETIKNGTPTICLCFSVVGEFLHIINGIEILSSHFLNKFYC